jgi:hypothetical protein
MLLIVSPISKANYLKYGDTVYFDVTYNLVREQWHRQKFYGIGFFSGVDCNKRIIIFGYSLLSTETANDFKKLIVNFV